MLAGGGVLNKDLVEKVLNCSLSFNVSYADVRLQESVYELVVVDNESLKEYSKTFKKGLGVRVLVDGAWGFSSTNELEWSKVEEAVERAVSSARAVGGGSVRIPERRVGKALAKAEFKVDPLDVDPEDKVKLVLEVNKASKIEGIKSSLTKLGVLFDRREVLSTDGADVEVSSHLVGISHLSVAFEAGVM